MACILTCLPWQNSKRNLLRENGKTIRRNIYVTELMLKSDSVLLKIHEKNEKRKKKINECLVRKKSLKTNDDINQAIYFFFKLCVAI